ncbi:MAG: hypothetical protein KBD76_06400 [Bacteriovorax sp.]|nr:hypothetical protein [Bacteriovorax sp.]
MKNALLLFFFLSSPLFSADNPTSDFLSLCKVSLTKTLEHEEMCSTIHQKFFSKVTSVDIANYKPSDVLAPPDPIDSKIQYLVFNDPNYVPGVAYCYFVFRGWVSMNSMSPDAFGESVSGFSILNEDIKKYQQWLKQETFGKKCQQLVEKDSQVQIVNLEETLKLGVALIGLNPYALIKSPGATTESVLQEMKTTTNHERIHAYQVLCPLFEKWSIDQWGKLATKEKNIYIKKYNAYNWSIPQIAGREFIAFLYETAPEKIAEQVKSCSKK